MTTDRRELGRLVRKLAVSVRACFTDIPEIEAAVARLVRGIPEPFAITDLPHTLVPVPSDEVWFFTGGGQRIVLGPRTGAAR